jgi:hypothetical protein
VANSTIGSYNGTNNTQTVGSQFGSGTDAVTIPSSTYVAVGSGYFTNETQTQQIAIAIHETLHVALGLGDGDLEQALQQFGFPQSVPNSGYITDWIVGTKDQMSTTGGGCKNP